MPGLPDEITDALQPLKDDIIAKLELIKDELKIKLDELKVPKQARIKTISVGTTAILLDSVPDCEYFMVYPGDLETSKMWRLDEPLEILTIFPDREYKIHGDPGNWCILGNPRIAKIEIVYHLKT